jgi:hypothetical protein
MAAEYRTVIEAAKRRPGSAGVHAPYVNHCLYASIIASLAGEDARAPRGDIAHPKRQSLKGGGVRPGL